MTSVSCHHSCRIVRQISIRKINGEGEKPYRQCQLKSVDSIENRAKKESKGKDKKCMAWRHLHRGPRVRRGVGLRECAGFGCASSNGSDGWC